MKLYIFEGYSDDTFGEGHVTNIDYDDCASGSVIEHTLTRPNGEGVLITGQYLKSGCWHIGVSLLHDDKPLNAEEWRFRLSPQTTYHNRLEVVAPDDTIHKCLRSGETEEMAMEL